MPFITSVSGKFGYGRSVAPVNTSVSLAGSLFFNNNTNTYLNISPGVTIGSGAYTIETWFYNNVDWATQRCLLGGFTANTGSISVFFTVPSAGTLSVTTDKYGGGGQRSYSFPTPSLNAWHHFAMTRNSSQVESIFIDGVKSTGASGGTSVSGGQQVLPGVSSVHGRRAVRTRHSARQVYRARRGQAHTRPHERHSRAALARYFTPRH